MTRTVRSLFLHGTALMACAALVLSVFAASVPASAQQGSGLGSVIGGAAVGAIVGGAVKGKKGAAVGAGVGAALGAAAAANSRNARRNPPPPRYYQPAPRQPVYGNGLVYNIQVSLTNLGYNPGPVDGVYGQRTADAISAYEYNNQLPVTGQPSQGIYQHMRQSGG